MAMEALAHDVVDQRVGQRDQRHALVMREVCAHDRDLLRFCRRAGV
jgi:hypothetical protein